MYPTSHPAQEGKNKNKTHDIDRVLSRPQARCWALSPVSSLPLSHDTAGVIFIVPILQIQTPKSGAVKVTGLRSQSEETVHVGFESGPPGSMLFAVTQDEWWHICNISCPVLSPALRHAARPMPGSRGETEMDALLPLIKHAHVLSCQLPRLSQWMSTTEIYSQKCNCHGQDRRV